MSALNPHTLISQYGHTAWRSQDGFIGDADSITQTSDGYIWIATGDGLFRSDGVKFLRWTPPNNQSLPSTTVNALLAARDGSLWIGTSGGLAHWKDGRLTNYKTTPGDHAGIYAILEDHTGKIWVTRYRIGDETGSLCWVKGSSLECLGENEGNPAEYGGSLTEDSTGNIWFGGAMLYRWHQGSVTTYFDERPKIAATVRLNDVIASPSGEVWASLDETGPNAGVQHFSDGKWSSYIVPGFDGRAFKSTSFFIDSRRTLWIGTNSGGFFHIHDGQADHYGTSDGLSGDHVHAFYEDKEGNLWVATDFGIDLFRDNAVTNFSKAQGLMGDNTGPVLAVNGDVWVSDEVGLSVIQAGAFSAIRRNVGPGRDIEAMFVDSKGQVWLSVDDKILVYKDGQYVELRKDDGSPLGKIGGAEDFAEDTEGNLWFLNIKLDGSPHADLFMVRDRRVQESYRLEDIKTCCVAADRQAGIWALSDEGVLAYYVNGRAQKYVRLDEVSSAYSLSVDAHNAVWSATNKGLYRWSNDQLTVMDLKNGLPCAKVYSLIQDDQGSRWLRTQCGILRITADEWERWLKFPEGKVAFVLFDTLDGARSSEMAGGEPLVTKSRDGRLWFATGTSVQMVDPNRLFNVIPPPVHIEEVVADHKSYEPLDKVALPHLRGELEIDYTALSFKLPQKVLFRYKLEGHDEEWQEAGTRRQAFYNDLPPKKYRFRVIACNSDGIWNEVGTFIDFSIRPAWYQTGWFRALCIGLAALTVWVLYRVRLRQVAHVMSVRFDERLSERTRIARDLHDTFLQTIQGSKLVADSALKQPGDPIRMRSAMEQVSTWLGRATEEGRASLNSLRTSATEKNDLAAAFQRAIEECRMQSSIDASLSVIGEVSEMHPIIRDEVYRIGYEAIRNACTHSQATRLQVELTYAEDLILRVSDNGVGIDPAVVGEGKEGHFGLEGMRERAHRIMAKLTVETSPFSGTEIRLVVSGSIIYHDTPPGRRKLFTLKSFLERVGLKI